MNAVKNPSDLYAAQRRIRHIDTVDCHVTEIQLAPDQCIPWHKHTAIRDTFYVLDGAIRISMREPLEAVEVQPGETFAVGSGRPHLVENPGSVATTFLVLQGIGACDFVPLAKSAGAPPMTDPVMRARSKLFSPFHLGGLGLKNRIVISPMCQYAAQGGAATDWHAVHIANLALSGAALVFVEATAVAVDARITKNCLGLFDDACEGALRRVFETAKRVADVPVGIQLSHAGRKASSGLPWEGGGLLRADEGGWLRYAPSAVADKEGDPAPQSMSAPDMDAVVAHYCDAALRARRIGFDCIELQMAHGYLMHQFLSPLSNLRTDEFGGSIENRIRYPLRVFKAVRETVGDDFPVGVRVSATDWVEQGWDIAQTTVFALALEAAGCDFIDVSSGGLSPKQRIVAKPGYQVEFAAQLKAALGIPVIAVGMITEAQQAERIVAQGQADLIAIARSALYDPRWPWRAAAELGASVRAPRQFHRCLPEGSPNIFAFSD
jgi:2,4-dienoyl-CoA reductase-like NADH-dependent reductase (Old Yellow Enzyme family)/mannose-6-phosphate isomerase-like protein (cupin superfamily)